MSTKYHTFDAIVVGGGLSGLCASLCLGTRGASVLLLDEAITGPKCTLGGFAQFSGAKFSMPPAGMGILPITGSIEALTNSIEEVLSILGLDTTHKEASPDISVSLDDQELANGVQVRKYSSIVVTPKEIEAIISSLANRVRNVVHVVHGRCKSLTRTDSEWACDYIEKESSSIAYSKAVFFAGGRLGADLLQASGCNETSGKGLDLGLRVEFPEKSDLRSLRDLGPDAKIIANRCRTFCLNFPGKIHMYPFRSIQIPGGVVAEESHSAANVGLLYRTPKKAEVLDTVVSQAGRILQANGSRHLIEKDFIGPVQKLLLSIYGEEVVEHLVSFGEELSKLGLASWTKPHYVHLPLLDWHWPTYSRAGTFESTEPGLFVLGDCSGHARGLLQAAVSGYIAVQEYTT